MRKTRIAAVAALSGALLVPVAALAATTPRAGSPPHLPSSYIVPSKSLGGLRLGAPASTAMRVFPAKDCRPRIGCGYSAPDSSWEINVIFASLTTRPKPFIGEITFQVEKPSAPSLPNLKTSSGIGLGSSLAELKHAYPKLHGPQMFAPGSLSFNSNSHSKLPDTNYTAVNGHVTEISLQSVSFG